MTATGPGPVGSPVISVAVSTYQRAEKIAGLLTALEQQTLDKDRFEVVVVDDACTDGTSQLLDHLAQSSKLDLRVVHLSQNRGQAPGRNEAWQRARGEVIAFTDDDCLPTPDWLERGLEEIRRSPGVLVGATQPDPAQRHHMTPLARTMNVKKAALAPTCNAFYLRSDLEAVGGFDETFGASAGEDTDLAWRVHERRGREIRFVPEALVYHEVRARSLRQAIRESRRWAGVLRVVKRHPALAREAWWYGGYFLRPSHPRLLAAVLGIALARAWPPSLLLTLFWLRHRVLRGRPGTAWIRSMRYAPSVFVLDAYEVWVLARASISHRTLFL